MEIIPKRREAAKAGARLFEHYARRFPRPLRGGSPLLPIALRIFSAYLQPRVRADDAEIVLEAVARALGLPLPPVSTSTVVVDAELADEGRTLLEVWAEGRELRFELLCLRALHAAAATALERGEAPDDAADALATALRNACLQGLPDGDYELEPP